MKYPLGKLLKNFANMSRAEIHIYLANQKEELKEIWEINKNRTMVIDASDSHQAIGQIDMIKEILGEDAKLTG